MAKQNWLLVNPSTGSGNGTISNSAAAHTGRVARVTNVTVTGVGVSTPATYKVTRSRNLNLSHGITVRKCLLLRQPVL